MKINNLPFLLVLIFASACYETEMPYMTCPEGIPVKLLAQDRSESVCGGYYVFAEYDTDTLHIQYNDVLRDFFVDHQFTAKDFPIAVDIVLKSLEETDPCKDQLQQLDCISLGYIRHSSLP